MAVLRRGPSPARVVHGPLHPGPRGRRSLRAERRRAGPRPPRRSRTRRGEVARARSEAGPFAVEMRVLTPTGETQWLEVHGTSVHDETGFVHACGTVQDVTRRKEQEIFRELLLVTLGHDLRNPLTAIQIGAGLLLRRGRLGESDSNTAQRVLASAGGSRPWSSSCSTSRASASAAACRARAARATSASSRPRQSTRSSAGARTPIELTSDGDLDGIWDVERLGQMIRNLVSNAMAHGDAASPVTDSRRGPRRRREPHRPQLRPADRARRDRRSVSTSARSAQSATRLGRASASSSFTRLSAPTEGTMQVASSAEDGTRFSVLLPRDGESTH